MQRTRNQCKVTRDPLFLLLLAQHMTCLAPPLPKCVPNWFVPPTLPPPSSRHHHFSLRPPANCSPCFCTCYLPQPDSSPSKATLGSLDHTCLYLKPQRLSLQVTVHPLFAGQGSCEWDLAHPSLSPSQVHFSSEHWILEVTGSFAHTVKMEEVRARVSCKVRPLGHTAE